jgi:hypothetical protein
VSTDNDLARAEQPFSLHLVQGGIERTRADGIAVVGEFGCHPGAVDLFFSGVVEDVKPDCPPQKLSHDTNGNRYRFSISMWATPDSCSSPYRQV